MLLRNLKELQAYPEFRTTAGIDQVREAVQTNTLPTGMTPLQTTRFIQKFMNGNFIVSPTLANQRGVQAHGTQRLKYRVADHTFLVAYPDERTIFLERIWRNPRRGYGVGLHAFYLQVAQTHLNIQKKYTDAFLKGKGDYQIQKVPVKKVNRPIISKTSNERWGMDLISMTVGNTNRYIFTVVDNFSGFLWTRRITNRTAQTIVNNLQSIVSSNLPRGSGGTAPRLLQCDQGPEFNNQNMFNFCNANNIKLILSKSYSPAANGKIERKNREDRKKIKAGFIRQNRNLWNATMLNYYTQNINSQVDLRSRFRPVDLYQPGYNPPDEDYEASSVPLANNNTQLDIEDNNRVYHRNRAIQLTNGRRNRFQVGDLVRVNIGEVSDEYRRIRKEKMGNNKIAVHYSPVVSRVMGIYPPNNNTRFVEMYSIAVGDENGLPPPANEPVWTLGDGETRFPHLFTGNQLVLAGDRVSINPRSVARANALNRRN